MASLDDDREGERFSDMGDVGDMLVTDEAFRAQLCSMIFGRRARGEAVASADDVHWMSGHRRREDEGTPS